MQNFNITGKSQVCGIFGDPVEHSMSPAIQNAAFAALGLDYVYIPFRVDSKCLKEAVQSIRALNLKGVNVTVPHKVAVIQHLDELDSQAETLGAVNTIVNAGGILKGYNTDALGFYRALSAEGIELPGKRVTILGAGGAARAIAFILADKGVQLTILNRDEARAERLAEAMVRLFRREVAVGGLTKKNVKKVIDSTEILVNTTSVGMLPDTESSPLPPGLLRPEQVVFDIVYNPPRTALLKEAEALGARAIGGLEMLVQQGAAGFELWTGRKAPLEVMRSVAASLI